VTALLVCYNCGTPEKDEAGRCPHCGRSDFISETVWKRKQGERGGRQGAIAQVAPHVAERLTKPLVAEPAGGASGAPAAEPASARMEAAPVQGWFGAELKYVVGTAIGALGLWLAFAGAVGMGAAAEMPARIVGGLMAAGGAVLLALGIWDTVQGGASARRPRVILGAVCAVVLLGLASYYINPLPGAHFGHEHAPAAEQHQGSPQRPEVEELGDPSAKVTVEGLVPSSQCFDPALDVVRKLAEAHPHDVCVKLYALGSEKGKGVAKKYNQSCAGFFINGKMGYTFKDADGVQRECYFDRSPGEQYTADDLQAALKDAIAKAKAAPTKPAAKPSGNGAKAKREH
jgi:hypothetical protein